MAGLVGVAFVGPIRPAVFMLPDAQGGFMEPVAGLACVCVGWLAGLWAGLYISFRRLRKPKPHVTSNQWLDKWSKELKHHGSN